MTQGKITASAAMLNVLKTWGVDTIYGIPSGTLSSLMDALAEDKDIRFCKFVTKKLVLLQRLCKLNLVALSGLQLVQVDLVRLT